MRRIHSLLVANRSEIAIRVMRAAAELGIRTVSIYSNEDRFALHRFKADESYLVGEGRKPLQAYLDIDDVIRIARLAKVDAIHPGYGFLSENPDFARACAKAGIAFVGPTPEAMTTLGNKIAARNAAAAAGVPVMPATDPLPKTRLADDAGPQEIAAAQAADLVRSQELAAAIGYPLMLKASWGGGGRGMRVIESAADLEAQLEVARREAGAAFGNDEVYLEKLVRRARHVEVQILGDTHGNVVHLFERDCSVQRRNQKVVERAPAPYLDDAKRAELCEAALSLGPRGALHARGNRRVPDGRRHRQVLLHRGQPADPGRAHGDRAGHRHRHREGADPHHRGRAHRRRRRAGAGAGRHPPQRPRAAVPDHHRGSREQLHARLRAHLGVPQRGRLRPSSGRRHRVFRRGDHALLRLAAGQGHRLGADASEAIRRMDRGLREFRIRGVATNLQFVENVINHPDFLAGTVTTRFIDDTPELFRFARRRDRATRVLRYLGDVTVNGHPDMKGRVRPDLSHAHLLLPPVDLNAAPPPGTRTLLRQLGPEKLARWMLDREAHAAHRHHDARRAPVAARDADANDRHAARSRPATRACCPGCSRSSAGAARPSTSRCAS